MPISIKEKIRRKWKKNALTVGAENFEEMVKLVDVNPMELAAANAEKWKAKLQAVFDIWPEIMRKIPVDRWKKFTIELGPGHYRDGVDVKAEKMEEFAEKWDATYGPELSRIRALPNKTDADREKRMLENLKALKKLKGKWR